MADFDILSIAKSPEESEKLKQLLERKDLPAVRDTKKISENDEISYDDFMSTAAQKGWDTQDPAEKELLDAAYDIAAESTNYMAASFPVMPHETAEQRAAALEALLVDAAGSFTQGRISRHSLDVVCSEIESERLKVEQKELSRELESLGKELDSINVAQEKEINEEENLQFAEMPVQNNADAVPQQEPKAQEPFVPELFDSYVRYGDFINTSSLIVREKLQNAGIPFNNDADHGLSYEGTVGTAFVLYLLSEEGMSTEDLKKLDSLSPIQKKVLGARFVQACKDHPVMPGAASSAEETQINTEWFGRMTAKAIGKLKEEGIRFPSAADIGNPEKDKQLMQSNFELLGKIGANFKNLTATWFEAAGENAFAQGYGGMTELQKDRNILSAAHVVSRAAGLPGRHMENRKMDRLKKQVQEELLSGVEGQPVAKLNEQDDRLKGIRLEEAMQTMAQGGRIRRAEEDECTALFYKLSPASDDLRLEPYIVMPELASLDQQALDQAAKDFDEIFRPLQEKEQPVFDLGGGRLTKGIRVSDTTVDGRDHRIYSVTSAVREALGNRQVTEEELVKYEKAYTLQMLADPSSRIRVSYLSHYLSQEGTAQDPVWTAESSAQDPSYDISVIRQQERDRLEDKISEMKTALAQQFREIEEMHERVNANIADTLRLRYERDLDLNKLRVSRGLEPLTVLDPEESIRQRAEELVALKENHQAKLAEEEAAMRLAYEQQEQQRMEAFRTRREAAKEKALQEHENKTQLQQKADEERQRLTQREEVRRAEREKLPGVMKEAQREAEEARMEAVRKAEEERIRQEEERIRQEEERRRSQEERGRRAAEIRRRMEEIPAIQENNRIRQEELAGRKAQMKEALAEAVRKEQERQLQLAKEKELREAKEKVAREGYKTAKQFLTAAYENGWDAHTDQRVLKALFLIYDNNRRDRNTRAQKAVAAEAKELMTYIGLNRVNSEEERAEIIGRMKEMVFRHKYENLGPEDLNAGRKIVFETGDRIAAWNTEHPNNKALQNVLNNLAEDEKRKDAERAEKLRRENEERERLAKLKRERREAEDKKHFEEQKRAREEKERVRKEQERVRLEQEKALQEEKARRQQERERARQQRSDALHAQYALEWKNRDAFLDAAKKNGWAPDGENMPYEDRRALKSLFLAYDGVVRQMLRNGNASAAEKQFCDSLKPVLTQIGARQSSDLQRVKLMARAAGILEQHEADKKTLGGNQLNNAKTNIEKWQKVYPDQLSKKNITLERFKDAAYENGWTPERDGKALETIFANWKKQTANLEAEAKAWDTVNDIAQRRLDAEKPVTDRNQRLKSAAAGFEEISEERGILEGAAKDREAGEELENRSDRRRTTLRNIRHKSFLIEYDEFLPQVYNSMFTKDGEYNEQIRKLVRDAEDIGSFAFKNQCEDFLKQVKSAIDNIPEEERTDAQKKLADEFDEKLEEAGREADARADYTAAVVKNWANEKQPRDTLTGKLYAAAKGMPVDHPYRKFLEDFRLGKSEEHPEINGKSEGAKPHVVMNDLLHKAKGLLEKELNTRRTRNALDAVDNMIAEIRKKVILGNTGIDDIYEISKAAETAKQKIGRRDPEATALLNEAEGLKSQDLQIIFGEYVDETNNAILHLQEGVTKYLDKAKVRDRRSDAMLEILGHLDTAKKAAYEKKLQNLPEDTTDWWENSETFKEDAKANGWVSEQDQAFLSDLHMLAQDLKSSVWGPAKNREEQIQKEAERELLAKTNELISEIAENKAVTPQQRMAYIERFENFCDPYTNTGAIGFGCRVSARIAMSAAEKWHTANPSVPTPENLTTRNLTRALKRNGWDEKRDGALIDAMVKAYKAAGNRRAKDGIWSWIEVAMGKNYKLDEEKPLTDRDKIANKILLLVSSSNEMAPVRKALDECIKATAAQKELEDLDACKKQFERKLEKNNVLPEYIPILKQAYGTGFTKEGQYQEKIREELEKAGKEDHSSRESCDERLNAIKNELDDIPAYRRTEAQKQFIDSFDREMQKIAQGHAKADKEKRIDAEIAPFESNWSRFYHIEKAVKKLAMASDGMPENHPLRKVLDDFRKGKCDRIPELNGKSADDKYYIVMHELLKDAIGSLEKEEQTQEIKEALDSAKKTQDGIYNLYIASRNPAKEIREIGQMGTLALERAGANAGQELTNVLQHAAAFSQLYTNQFQGRYQPATLQAIESLETELCNYLNHNGPEAPGAAEVLLILEKLNPALMPGYQERFGGLWPAKEDLARKNGNIPNYRNELQQAQANAQDHGYTPADPNYRLLPEKSAYLLSTKGKLDELSQMFDTRKTGWRSADTGFYTDAKTALDNYTTLRDNIIQGLPTLIEQMKSGEVSVEQFRNTVSQSMTELEQLETTLRTQMRRYAVHATNGSLDNDTLGSKTIDKMHKSAGAARLAASMGVLEYLDTAKSLVPGEVVQQMERANRNHTAERAKEITFQELYRQQMAEDDVANIQDVAEQHILAVRRTRQKMKENNWRSPNQPNQHH